MCITLTEKKMYKVYQEYEETVIREIRVNIVGQ